MHSGRRRDADRRAETRRPLVSFLQELQVQAAYELEIQVLRRCAGGAARRRSRRGAFGREEERRTLDFGVGKR